MSPNHCSVSQGWPTQSMYNNEIASLSSAQVIRNPKRFLQDDALLSLNNIWWIYVIQYLNAVSVNLLAWSFDCYCLFSLLSFSPRAALHSSSHLCALGAGMQHACPREEAAAGGWTPDAFRECRLDIITGSNQNALMIWSISRRATCVIRSLSPRDNNLISRAGGEAQ